MKQVFLWLHIIRWKNLLLLLFCQLLIKYRVFTFYNTSQNLTDIEFFLLVFSVLTIAAAGYIINDFFDIECDKINKPDKVYIPHKISIKHSKITYSILSVLGIISGSILSIHNDKPLHIFTFSGIVLLLYLYSYGLKKIALIGNIVIASLICFTLILLISFETYLTSTNEGVLLIIHFAYFSFFINIFREIIKDLEDQKGDFNAKMKTLPIVLGRERTVKLLLIFSFIPIYFVINFGLRNLESNLTAQIIYFLIIALPYFIYLYKLYIAKSKKDFTWLSNFLKVILGFGLLLLFIITT